MSALVTRLAPQQWLLFIKIFIYGSLCLTCYQFLMEDFAAAKLMLNKESDWREVLNIFSVSIDTLAWLSLLVVFELETSVIDDEKLTGWLKKSLTGVSLICYLIIVYAFVGYTGKMLMLSKVEPLAVEPCSLSSQYVQVVDMDEYSTLGPELCSRLNQENTLKLAGEHVVIENSVHGKVMALAWASVINSLAWILVVAILQFDIFLQTRQRLSASIYRGSSVIKAALYATLVCVAVFWGLVGSFVDFADAVLWLAGFWIIELNVFNWNKETR